MSNITDVAETLYKEINPDSKMGGPPSMIYEIIEKKYKEYFNMKPKLKKETSFEDYARLVLRSKAYSKKQMILMVSWGYHMAHDTFNPEEYLTSYPGSKIHFSDEDNNVINMKQFWKYRTQPVWKTGWSVHKKQIN